MEQVLSLFKKVHGDDFNTKSPSSSLRKYSSSNSRVEHLSFLEIRLTSTSRKMGLVVLQQFAHSKQSIRWKVLSCAE